MTEEDRCPYCDDTGDVHSIDGTWLGECNCANACLMCGNDIHETGICPTCKEAVR